MVDLSILQSAEGWNLMKEPSRPCIANRQSFTISLSGLSSTTFGGSGGDELLEELCVMTGVGLVGWEGTSKEGVAKELEDGGKEERPECSADLSRMALCIAGREALPKRSLVMRHCL